MMNTIPRTKSEINELEQALKAAVENFQNAKHDQDETRATEHAVKVAELADQLVRSEEQ